MDLDTSRNLIELKSKIVVHRGREEFSVPVTWWCHKKELNLKMRSIFFDLWLIFPVRLV